MICVKQQAGGRGALLSAIKSFNPLAVPSIWHSAVDVDVLAVRSACKERQEREFGSSKKSERKGERLRGGGGRVVLVCVIAA